MCVAFNVSMHDTRAGAQKERDSRRTLDDHAPSPPGKVRFLCTFMKVHFSKSALFTESALCVNHAFWKSAFWVKCSFEKARFFCHLYMTAFWCVGLENCTFEKKSGDFVHGTVLIKWTFESHVKKNLIHTFKKVYFFNGFWFVKDDPEGHNIRARLLLCFSLLGFFLPKFQIFLTCGHFARLKKDASLSGFYSFRGQ